MPTGSGTARAVTMTIPVTAVALVPASTRDEQRTGAALEPGSWTV